MGKYEIDLNHMSDKEYLGLPIKYVNDAIEEAIGDIQEERSGEQLGLYCPFPTINRGMGKYFRFANINLFFSKSGHGKSYMYNQMLEGFSELSNIPYTYKGEKRVKKGLNSNFKEPVIFLHASYEMTAKSEVLRTIGRKVNVSYEGLLSSEYDYKTNSYKRLDDKQFEKVIISTKLLKDRPIYYIEESGLLTSLFKTITGIKKANPKIQIVLSIDHILLSKKKDGQTDNDLMSKTAYMGLILRKKVGAMVNFIAQMNEDINHPERRKTYEGRLPRQGDIHGSNQLGWACDNIWCFPYRPELLNFDTYPYNSDKIRTDSLVVASKLKSRHGFLGDVMLKEELNRGRFKEMTTEELNLLVEESL